MALRNKAVGARVRLPIGRKGETPDLIPARISGPVTLIPGPRGMQEWAEVVMLRTSLKGEQFLQTRTQNLYFAFDRSEVVPALDAEPISTLVAKAAEDFLNYLMTGQTQTADLDEIEV